MGTKSKNRTTQRDWKCSWSRVVVMLLLFATMVAVLTPQQAGAVTVNGEAGGSIPGASNTNVTGGYAIRSTTRTMGFRFTVVSEDGTEHGAPKDIYAEAFLTDILDDFKNYGILDVKRNKMDYALLYKSSSTTYNYTPMRFETPSAIANGTDRFLDTDLGLVLPVSAEDMVNTWAYYDENIDKVLDALWDMDLSKDLADNDYHLAVEPIYAVKIGGMYFPLTVTEAVIYAALDGTAYAEGTTDFWNTKPQYTGDNGTTWKTISGYTHGAWPESMKLAEAAFGLADPSTTLKTSSRGTAKNIIEKGYGIIDISEENFATEEDPATYTNSIAFWLGGLTNSEGNNAEGTWYYLGQKTFDVTAGQDYTLSAGNSYTVPNGCYLVNTIGNSSITGTWTRHAMPLTFTQLEQSMSFEYDFQPYTYTISYNLNGGTNHSSNPTSYNVFYGKQFYNPTRTNYTFTGWTVTT